MSTLLVDLPLRSTRSGSTNLRERCSRPTIPPVYRAALARLVDASSQFEKAQAENCSRVFHAEQEFHEALEAYAAARHSPQASPAGLCDGVKSLQAWLGPSILVSSTPHYKSNEQSEAG